MKPSINRPSSKSRLHKPETPAVSAGVSDDSISVQFDGYAFGGDALARLPDGRAFVQAGYGYHQVTLFDLFPQTCHIESISFWQQEGSE